MKKYVIASLAAITAAFAFSGPAQAKPYCYPNVYINGGCYTIEDVASGNTSAKAFPLPDTDAPTDPGKTVSVDRPVLTGVIKGRAFQQAQAKDDVKAMFALLSNTNVALSPMPTPMKQICKPPAGQLTWGWVLHTNDGIHWFGAWEQYCKWGAPQEPKTVFQNPN